MWGLQVLLSRVKGPVAGCDAAVSAGIRPRHKRSVTQSDGGGATCLRQRANEGSCHGLLLPAVRCSPARRELTYQKPNVTHIHPQSRRRERLALDWLLVPRAKLTEKRPGQLSARHFLLSQKLFLTQLILHLVCDTLLALFYFRIMK